MALHYNSTRTVLNYDLRMIEMILARHGETDWNRQEVFRGRSDIALNESGIRQAEQLAYYLEAPSLEAVFSSPLKRVRQIAEIVARRHHINPATIPDLTDFDYGRWQGLRHRKVKEKYPELYSTWLERPHRFTAPGGESLADVRKRVLRVVKSIQTRYRGRVLLVSHRVVNKILICALLGLSNSHFWNIRQDTCGITTFYWEKGHCVLIEHNNTSYLNNRQKQAPDF